MFVMVAVNARGVNKNTTPAGMAWMVTARSAMACRLGVGMGVGVGVGVGVGMRVAVAVVVSVGVGVGVGVGWVQATSSNARADNARHHIRNEIITATL